jgi:hypothetical protein
VRYRVVYTEQFHAALDAQLTYFTEQGAPETRIANWLSELLDRVDSLNEPPHRFAVDEARGEVQLLGFRHGARQRDPEAGSL